MDDKMAARIIATLFEYFTVKKLILIRILSKIGYSYMQVAYSTDLWLKLQSYSA
jgi:hypothetical protein